MKNYQIVLTVLGILVLISLFPTAKSMFSNYFNNSLSGENLTFTGNQNITRYLDIPKRANVTYAFMNFSGYSNTSLCYQETATVATSCGGLNTGGYSFIADQGSWNDPTFFYDGDWATSAYIDTGGLSNGEILFNYTKPVNSLNSSIWEIRSFGSKNINLSIANCWNAYTNIISFRVIDNSSTNIHEWDCYNGTAYTALNNSDFYKFSEEAMIWNITYLPNNPFIEAGTPDGIYEWSSRLSEFKGNFALLRALNDSSTIYNSRFLTNQNNTIYLNLPKNSVVLNSSLNLSGVNGTTYSIQTISQDDSENGRFGDDYAVQSWTAPSTFYMNGFRFNNFLSQPPDTGATCGIYPDVSGTAALINGTIIEKVCQLTSPYKVTSGNVYYLGRLAQQGGADIDLSVSGSNVYSGGQYYRCTSPNTGCTVDANKDWHMDMFSVNYTSNTTLSINSTQVWNYTGSFILPNHTSDFSSAINSYLLGCTNNSENYCQVPIILHSNQDGIIQISDIIVNYTNASATNNLAIKINSILNNSQCSGGNTIGRNCSIPFLFHSDSVGLFQYSNINLTYITTPNITLISPINGSVSGVNKTFNCTVDDDSQLVNMTFLLWNSTKSLVNYTTINISGYSNQTLINITFNYSDTYSWNCLVFNNDTKALAPSNFSLTVDLINLVTNLNSPSNNVWSNRKTNVDFNCTTEGSNAGSGFLYINGTINQTITPIVSSTLYNFKANLTEGSFLWTCAANKTISPTITVSQQGNFTINVDTIYPNETMNSITANDGSQTISFNATSRDTNTLSCKYTLFNSTGSIDGLSNNVSYSCNTIGTATTTSFGTFNLTTYAIDLAGNENSSTGTFTISPSASIVVTIAGAGGGGGGGGASKVDVVALIKPAQDANTYTNLQRAILFSRIRNYTKVYGELLSTTRLNELSLDLKKDRLEVSSDLLDFWTQQYQNKNYEVVSVTDDQLTAYNLVRKELIFESEFRINPSAINNYRFVSLCNPSDAGKVVDISVKASKILQNCTVREGDFSCNVTSPSIAEISYVLNSTNITFANYEGEIEYVSADNEIARTKIQYLNVINVCGTVSVGGIQVNLIVFTLIILTFGSSIVFVSMRYIKKRKKSPISTYLQRYQ